MGYQPFPAHLCQYAAFLARSLNSSSIPNYLNIIGLLHKEFNLPNPLVDNWSLQSLLTGIKRVKAGGTSLPKVTYYPIYFDATIHSMLNMHSSFDGPHSARPFALFLFLACYIRATCLPAPLGVWKPLST